MSSKPMFRISHEPGKWAHLTYGVEIRNVGFFRDTWERVDRFDTEEDAREAIKKMKAALAEYPIYV